MRQQLACKKSGQTVVEYVLLMAMVAGLVVTLKVLIMPPLVRTLTMLMNGAGGAASQGGTDRYGSYYTGAGTFKK